MQRDAALAGLADRRQVKRHALRDEDGVGFGDRCVVIATEREADGQSFDVVQAVGQLVGRLGVGDRDVCAAAGQVAHEVDALDAEADDGYVLAREVKPVQLLEVDHEYTSNASAVPMIAPSAWMTQKRWVTCTSLQPIFSKWWCTGAILNRRLPVSRK